MSADRRRLKVVAALARVRLAQRDAAKWDLARAAARVEQARTDVSRLTQMRDVQVIGWQGVVLGANLDLQAARGWAAAVLQAQASLAQGQDALTKTEEARDGARQGLFRAETNVDVATRAARRIGRRVARQDEERLVGEVSDRVTQRWSGR